MYIKVFIIYPFLLKPMWHHIIMSPNATSYVTDVNIFVMICNFSYIICSCIMITGQHINIFIMTYNFSYTSVHACTMIISKHQDPCLNYITSILSVAGSPFFPHAYIYQKTNVSVSDDYYNKITKSGKTVFLAGLEQLPKPCFITV